ncbi:MAG: FHA domain-containing protein [Planctomycetota bacterium]|nr:FHA domain-containing protein [Planctomycetota bacterium]
MPRLVIRAGAGLGRDQVLGVAPCVLGRDPGVDFVLEDALASRRHARITAQGGAWFLEDLGSTNGTLVNDRRITRVQLADGDTVRIGGTALAFIQKGLLG